MAYETINVRMNRSNQSIHWGFTLRQGSGNEIVIANVERDSMAEKAGLCTNDIITDIMGAQGLNLSQANQKVNAAFEISMNLKRWVTNMPTLPWTLNEKDNKIVVSSVGNGGMRPLHTQNSDGFINSFSSTTQSGRGPSQSRELSSSNYQRNFQETRTQSSTSPGGIQLSQTSPRATFQPQISLTSGALNPKSNTMSTHSHSSWDTQDGNVKKHFESSKSYEKTESSSTTEFDRPIGAQGAFTHSGTAGFGSGINGFGSGAGAGSGGFISGGGAGGLGSDVNGFGSGAGGRVNTGSSFGKTGWGSSGFRDDTFRHNGINQQLNTQIPSQTGGGRAVSMQHSPAAFSPRAAQPQRPLTASPYTGPRQYYQHNPRTVRELSPTASVQHLQYNSPMNLYSSENAAEAYRQQTGGLFGTEHAISAQTSINRTNPQLISAQRRVA